MIKYYKHNLTDNIYYYIGNLINGYKPKLIMIYRWNKLKNRCSLAFPDKRYLKESIQLTDNQIVPKRLRDIVEYPLFEIELKLCCVRRNLTIKDNYDQTS